MGKEISFQSPWFSVVDPVKISFFKLSLPPVFAQVVALRQAQDDGYTLLMIVFLFIV